MRSALSLILIMCLAGSVPVATQEPFARASVGPIASSVRREAARVAAGQPTDSADPDWSRVRKLQPGTEIIVILNGAPPARRYFVAADVSELTVLNVTDSSLSTSAREMIRDVASRHPGHFTAAQRGATFLLDDDVRLAPDGVFIAGRKVVDLAQLVERYGRPHIAEIKTAATISNPVGCALAAYYGGALIGGLPGALIGGAAGRDTGPALLGMMVGWSVASVHVYRTCRHKPERDVYRAS